MFRAFNFQPAFLIQDQVQQQNWQILTDNTKSASYTPTTTLISNVQSTIGFYTYLGPWVLVNIEIIGSTTLTSGGTSYVSLPTPILAKTAVSVVYNQYLPIFNSNSAIFGGILNNGGTNSGGQCNIPSGVFGTANTITVQGIYLRN
jgi:hypothetical protein